MSAAASRCSIGDDERPSDLRAGKLLLAAAKFAPIGSLLGYSIGVEQSSSLRLYIHLFSFLSVQRQVVAQRSVLYYISRCNEDALHTIFSGPFPTAYLGVVEYSPFGAELDVSACRGVSDTLGLLEE